MIISLIAAMADNRVIGHRGTIPWQIPAEMRWFKAMTMGKPLILGRKTYESIGRPLPGRHMIVLTRRAGYVVPEGSVAGSVAAALATAGDVPEIMVGGGQELYRAFLPQATRLYLSIIEASVEGDTFFPELDWAEWSTAWSRSFESSPAQPLAYRSMIMHRRARPER